MKPNRAIRRLGEGYNRTRLKPGILEGFRSTRQKHYSFSGAGPERSPLVYEECPGRLAVVIPLRANSLPARPLKARESAHYPCPDCSVPVARERSNAPYWKAVAVGVVRGSSLLQETRAASGVADPKAAVGYRHERRYRSRGQGAALRFEGFKVEAIETI